MHYSTVFFSVSSQNINNEKCNDCRNNADKHSKILIQILPWKIWIKRKKKHKKNAIRQVALILLTSINRNIGAVVVSEFKPKTSNECQRITRSADHAQSDINKQQKSELQPGS